jgi:hypothetical protein
MKTTVYIIWNWKEKRPAIMNYNYGGLQVYLTLEQAQASLNDNESENLEIRKAFMDVDSDSILVELSK